MDISGSEALERGLGRRGVKRHYDRADELAEQLGLHVEDLRDAGYAVLFDLLKTLRDDLEQFGPWEWTTDVTNGRHKRIAEGAVESQSVEDVISAAHQFGWRRRKIEAADFSDVQTAVRDAFSRLLADRIRTTLEEWRKDNVWNYVMESRAEMLARRRAERAEDVKRPPVAS